jgi:hypothetical protein
MTDLVVTAASVVADTSARVVHGKAGATITAGQVVYLDPDTNTYKLADSNVAAARSPDGIALHASLSGQPLAVIESGLLTLGAILTAGVAYYLSDTPGGICPVADVGASEYSTILGIASSTSVLKMKISESGVAL